MVTLSQVVWLLIYYIVTLPRVVWLLIYYMVTLLRVVWLLIYYMVTLPQVLLLEILDTRLLYPDITIIYYLLSFRDVSFSNKTRYS